MQRFGQVDNGPRTTEVVGLALLPACYYYSLLTLTAYYALLTSHYYYSLLLTAHRFGQAATLTARLMAT